MVKLGDSDFLQMATKGTTLDIALAEISQAPTPNGVDPLLFDQLQSALAGQLEAIVAGRVVSIPPAGGGNQVDDLVLLLQDSGSYQLEWSYANVGDYDLNSEVNLADITPIALYYGATRADSNWAEAYAADGDGNNEVNLADITPIAVNYMSQVAGYNIYGAGSSSGPWTTVGSSTLAEVDSNVEFGLAFPIATNDHEYYQVVPADAAGSEGIPSLPSAEAGGFAEVFLGSDTNESTGSIGHWGGTLITPPGSPLEGVSISFPQDTLPDDTEVTLESNDGSVDPTIGEFSGVIFNLVTEGIFEYPEAVSLHIPFTGGENTVPVIYHIGSDNQLYMMPPPDIDYDLDTATTFTFHPGRYTWINDSLEYFKSTSAAKRTKIPFSFRTNPIFTRGQDGFEHVNMGTSPYTTGGECMGMSAFSTWYYGKIHKPARQPTRNLHAWGSRYIGNNFRSRGEIISTRAHVSIHQQKEKYYALSGLLKTKSAKFNLRYLCHTLINTGRPAVIRLTEPTGGGSNHVVLAYSYNYDAALGQVVIDIHDPNYPLGSADSNPADNQIIYEIFPGPLDPEFLPYGNFQRIHAVGEGALYMVEPFEDILKDALDDFGGSNVAQIDITSHSNGEVVETGTITLRGTIQSGDSLVEMVEIVGIGEKGMRPPIVAVVLDGEFELPDFPLSYGQNILLFVTSGKDARGRNVRTPNDLEGTGFTLTANYELPATLVTLTWDNRDAYLKMFVIGPDGSPQWYLSEYSQDHSGGELYGNFGFEGPIYFALTGSENDPIKFGEQYTVRVHYLHHEIGGPIPVEFTVDVSYNIGTEWETAAPPQGGIIESVAPFGGNDYPEDTGPDWGVDTYFTPVMP